MRYLKVLEKSTTNSAERITPYKQFTNSLVSEKYRKTVSTVLILFVLNLILYTARYKEKMDSRQFGVLLVAVFLAILAPIGNAEETKSTAPVPSETEISTHTSTTSTENPTSTQNPSIISGIVSSSTIKDPSSTIPEVITTPTVSLSTSASTTKVNQAVTASPANATNNPVTNDHDIRDVPSDKETCSTSFKAMLEKEKENWILEKAFLSVSGEDSTLTLEQFCKQLQTIMRLDTICNNGKNATAEDVKVAPIVAGLASMFTSVCSDPKTRLNVTVGDSTPCVEFIRTTAKSCSSASVTKAVHVYPTQVLFEEMTRDNCTVVVTTKDCITKALEQNEKCSPEQKNVIIDAMTKMTKGLPCVLPHSADAATSAPAITGPSVTTPKTPGNAGMNFQVNFFTIFPVLLLAFKFY
uniref:Uncharacterized protein n=1 Tax=Daphnia magna TaxID=35525 RepID=A0A0P6DIX8_9CRUS